MSTATDHATRQFLTVDEEWAEELLTHRVAEGTTPAGQLRKARLAANWTIRFTGLQGDDITIVWHGNTNYTIGWGTQL